MEVIRLLVFVAVAWQEVILIGAQASTKTGFRTNSGPSSNPIAVTSPNLAGGRKAVDATPGPFLRDFQPPFPTNAWWSGFTVSNQDAVAAGPFPFQSVTRNTGLEFGISDSRRFDGTSIHQATQFDWRFSFQELPNDINNRKAISWDTQTVCLRYMGSSATMDSCLVPGSPYLTISFSNATVLVISVKGNAGFTWITQGKKAKLTNDGGTYILYVLSGTLNLSKQSDSIVTSATTFTGTLRMAKVKETSQESILDSYSLTYPTGLDMTYTVSGNVSQQVWTWRTVGDSAKLLIMSWPHHRLALQSPKYANIQYLTLKGYMKGVIGNRWVLKHDLPTMTWFAQNSPHRSCLSELNKTLEAEVRDLTVMVPGDFYFWGGSFGRAAQLATIAEHIGRMDLVSKVVAILKQSVEYWFDANHRPAPAFETGWGGFINGDGWNNTWVDFGNGYYNDHHFHYGYLLHGAAVIGKYDKAWMDRNNEFFTQVARDIGNPSPSDPHYTVTRHMDWFAGHSWASGIANGAGSRDQESTTEAINGYYGLLLFATVTNNQALVDYSRMLLAIEVAGAQTYWHLYPSVNDSSTPYPEQGFRDLVTVGNVMDAQAGAWLFWGAQRIQIAAIQILPLTPIGQYTYDKGWMEKVVPYCQKELDDNSLGDDFKSVIWAAYSKVNPQLAANKSANLSNWGSGNSASNQLYFVSTQPSATNICSASSQTPEGTYRMQDVNSGKYITLANGNQLAATATADVLGASFKLGFTPGGGTIQATSNNQYVTASPDASSPLAAARDKAQGYETFRWARQSDDTYVLTAMVNKLTVSTTTDARLVNNGDVSRLRLIPTGNNSATTVPSQGVLRNSQSGKFVVSTSVKPTLMANSASSTGATVWSFERIAGTSDSAAKYAIKSKSTNQYVTANADGSSPLEAARNAAQGWEYFQLVPYQSGYLIVHDVNGYPVTIRSDSALVDDTSNTAVNASYVWNIQ